MVKDNRLTPLIHQGWFRAILFCVSYIVAAWLTGLLVGLVYTLVTVGSSGKLSMEDIGPLISSSLLTIAILSIAMTLVFRRYVDNKPITSLGISRTIVYEDVWTGLLLGVVLMGAGSLMLYFTDHLSWIDVRFNMGDLLFSLVLMLLVAVSEELVFRGYILNNLLESFNKWIALLISAVVFAIAHSLNPGLNMIAVINLLLGGVLLGINFIYTRKLWYSIAFHFSWNFLQGYVLGFAVSGLPSQGLLQAELKGTATFTGAQFGFEGSMVATGLLMMAILVLYYAYESKYRAE